MSYANKIGIYQGDCKVLLGKYENFSDYVREFSETITGFGLDLGAGPNSPNGKYFPHCILDGCDLEKEVVESIGDNYKNKFQYCLGSEEKLPYEDNTLDFLICSCVIQHLSSFQKLQIAFQEIHRVLKPQGKFYLMFKAGTNDTLLTHHNSYYNEERTFRVFDPINVLNLSKDFFLLSSETLLEDNWIPYSCCIFEKF